MKKCKHKWKINPEDPVGVLTCKICGLKESLVRISDDKLDESFGDDSEAIKLIKEMLLKFYESEENEKESM